MKKKEKNKREKRKERGGSCFFSRSKTRTRGQKVIASTNGSESETTVLYLLPVPSVITLDDTLPVSVSLCISRCVCVCRVKEVQE